MPCVLALLFARTHVQIHAARPLEFIQFTIMCRKGKFSRMHVPWRDVAAAAALMKIA